jgi:mono/diheme cytochrome c family protein
MRRVVAVGISVLALVSTAASFAGGAAIQLPEQTATLKPGPGADLANGQCLICHSAEYITTQPNDKPLAFWKAEVEKMKKVYGAPIPDDQVLALAAYLARNYGSENP